MATWLTHLRIAEKLKERIPDVDLPYLMMGSIAPDCGIPDKAARIYAPSKEITHCEIQIGEDKTDIDIASFFKKYMLPEKIFLKSDKTRSFFWGYYFHLLTDKIWADEYFKPFSEKYLQEAGETKVKFCNFLENEMYALDFVYLKSNGYGLLDKFKDAEADLGFFNEFDCDYIYKSKAHILNYYLGEAFLLKREFKYLHSTMIDDFIDIMTDRCMNILYK